MKRIFTLLIMVNCTVLGFGQWVDNGPTLITNDNIIVQGSEGIFFGSSAGGGANSILTGPNGFFLLRRNSFQDDLALSIDDDSGNFYLHPKGPIGMPAGTTVDLIFQTDQTTNINSRAGYINSNPGGLFVTSGTGILGLFGNSSVNLGSGTGQISIGNNTNIDISSPLIELTPISGPTYFRVDSTGVRIDGETMSWQVDDINISSNNPIDVEVDLHGNLNISGGIFGLSDKRLKSDIQPILNSLDLVMSLSPRSFIYNKDKNESTKEIHYGLVAQELEMILPDLVRGDNSIDDYKSINYQGLIPFLIGAIKEQQKQIEELKQKLPK